jgi:hypothetical protein
MYAAHIRSVQFRVLSIIGLIVVAFAISARASDFAGNAAKTSHLLHSVRCHRAPAGAASSRRVTAWTAERLTWLVMKGRQWNFGLVTQNC